MERPDLSISIKKYDLFDPKQRTSDLKLANAYRILGNTESEKKYGENN